METEDLYKLFKELTGQQIKNEFQLIQMLVIPLLTILGYKKENIFFEVPSPKDRKRYADLIVANERTSIPYILIETKRKGQLNTAQLLKYKELFDSRYGLFISEEEIAVFDDKNLDIRFNLTNASSNDCKELFDLLKAPITLYPNLPQVAEENEVTYFNRKTVEYQFYKVNLDDLARRSEAVRKAKTNQEKKKSFEELAEFLLSSITALKLREKNLITSTSEIDLVFENGYLSSKTIFDDFGRFILVECKNWSKPVGVGEVRNFFTVMDHTRAKLGIYFSKNGITGREDSFDALGVIKNEYSKNGRFLIIISQEDIQRLLLGDDFYQMIDQKVFKRRFDLRGV